MLAEQSNTHARYGNLQQNNVCTLRRAKSLPLYKIVPVSEIPRYGVAISARTCLHACAVAHVVGGMYDY